MVPQARNFATKPGCVGWSVCLVGSGGGENGDVVELVELGDILSPSGIDDIGVDQTTAKEVLAKLQAAFVALEEVVLKGLARKRVTEGAGCRCTLINRNLTLNYSMFSAASCTHNFWIVPLIAVPYPYLAD